jgi:hypothetical protein
VSLRSISASGVVAASLGFTCPFRIGPSITEYDLMGLWRMVDWLRLRWELRRVKLPDPPPRPTSYGLADGELLVGDYRIASFGHDEVRLLAVLQDQAITFTSERIGYPEMIITMPGRHVADRLDLLGTDGPTAAVAFDTLVSGKLAELDREELDLAPTAGSEDLHSLDLRAWSRRQDRAALLDLDFRSWVIGIRLAAATAEPTQGYLVGSEPENFWWLLHLVTGFTGVDDLLTRLRLVLLAFPDLPVTARILNPFREPLRSIPRDRLLVRSPSAPYFRRHLYPNRRAHRRPHRRKIPSRRPRDPLPPSGRPHPLHGFP